MPPKATMSCLKNLHIELDSDAANELMEMKLEVKG